MKRIIKTGRKGGTITRAQARRAVKLVCGKRKKKTLVGWTSFKPNDMKFHTHPSNWVTIVIPPIERRAYKQDYDKGVSRTKVKITIEEI